MDFTNLNFLNVYINPVIFGICLIMGFLVKYTTNKIPNRFIPLIATCLGVVLNIYGNIGNTITLDILLTGMASGLFSTAAYELVRNLISMGNKNE